MKIDRGEGARVWSLIVDFEDAFMSTSTRVDEQRFTAAKVIGTESPTGIRVYVWHTIGFGGKTFPLVYARPPLHALYGGGVIRHCIRKHGALIRGDNLGALNVALSLNFTGPAMNCIAHEFIWRRFAKGWQYKLKHLPAELNDEVDALSRLMAWPQREFPIAALQGATFVKPAKQD